MQFVNHIRQHFFAGFYKLLCCLFLLIPQLSFAVESSNTTAMWQNIEMRGTHQSVYFHAWGGDQQINNYIQWVAKQVKQRYNIDLQHVKLTDTSEAVSRVLAEKSANNHRNGQVDLVWINGANFASMAKYKLLALDWANKLPNFALTNPDNNPAMTRDFGVPTQGMEAPWGQAALTFYYDSLKVEQPPQTLAELLSWTKQHPGRFTYPKPPAFLGMSFLKYALIILNENQPDNIKNKLYQVATPESEAQILPVLWAFLDELHPNLWRHGHHFVSNGLALRRLSGDGELQVSFTFSAAEIPSAIARYDLPDSTRSYRMLDGSLSNIHFVAIPYNSPHIDSAKLVANFLLSPEAQAKKQQTSVWGDSSVLDFSQLSPEQHAYFDITEKQHSSAKIINVDNTRLLSELHPSWSTVITKQWLARYGVQ